MTSAEIMIALLSAAASITTVLVYGARVVHRMSRLETLIERHEKEQLGQRLAAVERELEITGPLRIPPSGRHRIR